MSKESLKNRRDSYNTLGDREYTTQKMLKLLSESEGLTDKEIASALRIDLSSVCSIRNNLIKADKVISNGSKLNAVSGKMNTTWTSKK